MEKIVSIGYDKRSAEFTIKYRDTSSGKASFLTANHLNRKEREFAESAKFHEDEYAAHWT